MITCKCIYTKISILDYIYIYTLGIESPENGFMVSLRDIYIYVHIYFPNVFQYF